MALLILALLQRIFLMSSLMLLLVWLIFFMVLIKLLPILGTISGKTVKNKQMDNRIKLLEEILSFRMQGVEFDNGDMYVDGHKAASDVRDEFVSVTEKLMDEL